MSDGSATKPARPKRQRRQTMPEALREHASVAGRRHDKRYPAPEVVLVPSGESWTFESPYRSADEAEWWRLLGEAFGTRTKAVIEVFMCQVAGLIGSDWDEETNRRAPNAAELQAAMSIVASLKPRNEAEAAQAAQLVAVHLATMRIGAGLNRYSGSYVDPRQANALGNLVKAYSGGMDSLRKGRAKGSTRQTIVVRKDVRIFNDNRSVTLPGGGPAADNQRQAAGETTRARTAADHTPCNGGTGVLIEGTALPSPSQTLGETLPGASGEGADNMPDALWHEANRA